MSRIECKTSTILLMEKFFRRYGLLFVFILFVFIVYETSLHHLENEIKSLSAQIQREQKLKLIANEEREKLTLQLQSQNDPSYCALLLMSRMGLCEKQQTKIYFKDYLEN